VREEKERDKRRGNGRERKREGEGKGAVDASEYRGGIEGTEEYYIRRKPTGT